MRSTRPSLPLERPRCRAFGLAIAAGVGLWMAAPAKAQVAPDGSTAEPARVERRVVSMGTHVDIAVAAANRGSALAASQMVVDSLDCAQERLSTWTADSELARFNRAPAGVPVELCVALARELSEALEWARATGGAFDPAVGALVALWDLRGAGRRPSQDEIALACADSTWRALAVEPGASAGAFQGYRRNARVTVEEGGFGKGAGLDAALAALASAADPVHGARLSFGGQVAWFGVADRVIAVAGPRDRARALVHVDAPPGAVSAATSANLRGPAGEGGEAPRPHLLDPRTGEPAADFGSATVFAPTALGADALSTGCFVLGPDGALALAERTAGVDVLLLIPTDGGTQLRFSHGLVGRVRAAPGFELVTGDGVTRVVPHPAPAAPSTASPSIPPTDHVGDPHSLR